MKKFVEILRSRPRTIDFILLVLTGVQAFFAYKKVGPDLWKALSAHLEPGRVEALYLGGMGTAAIVSGLSGVVVIFALTAPGRRFTSLRAQAGKELRATWLSTTASGFFSVLAFTTSVILSLMNAPFLAPYFFQAGVVILIHSSIRLLWLLGELSDVVVATDKTDLDKEKQVESASELFRKSKG